MYCKTNNYEYSNFLNCVRFSIYSFKHKLYIYLYILTFKYKRVILECKETSA